MPNNLSPTEKVAYLEQQRDQILAQAIEARRCGTDDAEHSREYSRLQEELSAMSFLGAGDLLDDRYCLQSYLDGGRTSVVWKAYDRIQDQLVAIKFLRHTYINDESLVRRFHYTVRLMADFSSVNVAAVRQGVHQLSDNRRGKLIYYVLEYVQGQPVDIYAELHPDRQALMIDGMLGLGRCLTNAHARGDCSSRSQPCKYSRSTKWRTKTG